MVARESSFALSPAGGSSATGLWVGQSPEQWATNCGGGVSQLARPRRGSALVIEEDSTG